MISQLRLEIDRQKQMYIEQKYKMEQSEEKYKQEYQQYRIMIEEYEVQTIQLKDMNIKITSELNTIKSQKFESTDIEKKFNVEKYTLEQEILVYK